LPSSTTAPAKHRLLHDAEALAALCRRACVEAGLDVVAAAFHQFPGAGATGALVLAESHLAVHTWPELDAVTLDLYVCNHSRDNRAAAEDRLSRTGDCLPGEAHCAPRYRTRGGPGVADLTLVANDDSPSWFCG
jgi:S-adenosylmethionine decarboxylase proenzyme